MRRFYVPQANYLHIFKKTHKILLCVFMIQFIFIQSTFSQNNQDGVSTYMNPILPGSHPDQTLLKVGNDYYTAGSSFHWAPNFPIYHSTDLVHWKIVSTVVDPNWNVIRNNATPKDGTWQGALANFDGRYWAFFFIHGAGQFFCTANSMEGPWSAPTLVQGSIGYDNAVYVDDDGRAYMLMKNGPDFAAIQELNTNGQLIGPRMDMSWVNRDRIYSWAEGPKMCKRNGRYYYFVAGHVYGGQYVLSSPTLTANESSWTRHGNFFRGNTSGPFSGPNHITSPVQIADGTWWCLAHSYGNNGWEGQGRQSMLFQVFWDANGVPYSNNPNGQPLAAPNLPSNGVNYEFPESDDFSSSTRKPEWYFHNVNDINKASVTARPGFMRLTPGTGTMHALQRDPAKAYSIVTKVEINATANGQHAGLRLMNGEDNLYLNVYSGYNNGAKRFGISFNGQVTEVNNTIGNTAWLKLVRNQHIITGFYSTDGVSWNQIGSYNATALDRAQDNDNAWVGTSMAIYATGQTADFDLFSYNHGFDPISVANYYHFNGVSTSAGTVTNSADGSWCMLPGVTMETEGSPANSIIVNAASANANGILEVWIDNIGAAGTRIATIPITNTGGTNTYNNFTSNVNVSGQHDLYLRFVGGSNIFRLNTVQFVSSGNPVVNITAPLDNAVFVAPASVTLSASASTPQGSVVKIDFYLNNERIVEKYIAPYNWDVTDLPAGNYTVRAVVFDNQGNTAEDEITFRVNVPQAPYGGSPHPIPGTIQAEEFDHGGNGFAYFDDTPGSQTGVEFRTDEDVDIEICTDAGGGYNVGWATAGEWLEYTVDVTQGGFYELDLRIACDGDDRTISVSMDGSDIAADIEIPNTTGWQVWQTVTVSGIELQPGQKIMRISIGDVDYVNINFVAFNLVEAFVRAPYNGAPHLIPGRIQAQEFDFGGQGIGYNEANNNGNEGGADLRNGEVDIEVTQDVDGEYNVGYILTGEWLAYTVEVASTGLYTLDARMATVGDGKFFHIEINAEDVTGPIEVPNTDGWQVWETVSVDNIPLTAGEHVMKIVFDSDFMNLNWVEFRSLITSAVENNQHLGISCFPNPYNSQTTLRSDTEFTYQIFSHLGVLLETGTGMSEKVIGADLEYGSYIVKVFNGDQFKVLKITKQ